MLEDTVRLAIDAGEVLLHHFRQPLLKQNSKSDVVDIVTEADRASESLIVDRLSALYPNTHIVGEEGGGVGTDPETAEAFWYVDPLDGTVNFANGIPHFCVSLGLTDRDGNPLLGVIFNPNTGEQFTAIKGQGAFLNHRPVSVGNKTTLVESILASGFAYDRRTNPDNNLPQWSAFMPQVRGLRRFGSAALDLAYVACGRFDGYWERGLKPWDAMAGVLLVREAGGIVTDYHGNETLSFVPEGRLVVSNPVLHGVMLNVVRETYES